MPYRKTRLSSKYGYMKGRYDYARPPTVIQRYIVREAAKAQRAVVRSLEDRRLWNPEPYRSPVPASLTRAARRLVVMPRVTRGALPRGSQAALIAPQFTIGAGVGFAQPKKVALCARRHSRREVLFAKGVGGTKVRRGKRNAWSDVQC